MQLVTLLGIGLLAVGVGEYTRPLGSARLDQATLDAEGYGEKTAFHREADGLRIKLDPGARETGWKTPPNLKIGGDFTITANLVIRKLPKPAQEDGVGVGLAIATQNVDQPDATLVRLIEPTGADVYRPVDRPKNGPSPQPGMIMMMPMQPFGQPGGKPPKPPRPTFPARGESVRIEMRREGSIVRYQVIDGLSDRPRYLGQVNLGPGDVAGVKLFATNRNGAEAVDVLLRDLTIRADRLNGLGTVVRTVFGEVVYGEPTALEDKTLAIGGQPSMPPGPSPPQTGPAPPGGAVPPPAPPAIAPAPAVATVAVAAPAPAPPAAVTVVKAEVKATAPEPTKEAQPAQARPPGNPSGPPAAPPTPPKPKAKIPLDEVESIRFDRTPALSARFLGQPNIDVTGPHPSTSKAGAGSDGEKKDAGDTRKADKDKADDVLAPPPGTAAAEKVPKVEPEKNGIRDLHLALANLRTVAIKQVTVTCQTDKGPTAWRLDTTDSRDGPLVLRRAGTEPWADLFLEPPPADCHQKNFTINVTYADGQPANANVQAGEHSDPKLAFDAEAPSGPLFDARVYMAGDQQLYGKLEQIGEDSLRLKTPWQDRLDVPLTRVVGVHIGLPERKETPESFASRLKSRGAEDLLLARTKDGEVVAISGIVEGTDGDRLRFRYQDRSRTLPLRLVEGLVLAARPEPKRPDGPVSSFALPGGLLISGRWRSLDASTWKVETAWGQTVNLPAADVQSVRFRGGQMTYLSDLDPSRVAETPFFGRRLPWRRDVNLLGEPLKMDGQTYERGLAVHSRCILTYDLDGRYTTFEALVGFDDAARGKGRVDCRVFADDKELYANPDLRADGPPVALALPVSGAAQLRLQVDFGQGQDTGDRLIWADARLYRRPPPGSRVESYGKPRGDNPPAAGAGHSR